MKLFATLQAVLLLWVAVSSAYERDRDGRPGRRKHSKHDNGGKKGKGKKDPSKIPDSTAQMDYYIEQVYFNEEEKDCLDFLTECEDRSKCSNLVQMFLKECSVTEVKKCGSLPAQCDTWHLKLTQLNIFQRCSCKGETSSRRNLACKHLRDLIQRHPCFKNRDTDVVEDLIEATERQKKMRSQWRDSERGERRGEVTNSKVTALTSPASQPYGNNNNNNHNSHNNQPSCLRLYRRCAKNSECVPHLQRIETVCLEGSNGWCSPNLRGMCAEVLEKSQQNQLIASLLNCSCFSETRDKNLKKCDPIFNNFVTNQCIRSIMFQQKDGSCVQPLYRCSKMGSCRSELVSVVQACQHRGPRDGTCSEETCHDHLRRFYRVVDRGLTEQLAFCSCKPENTVCQIIQGQEQLMCFEEERQKTTSCLDLVGQCEGDNDCKTSWHEFHYECQEDPTTGKCIHSANNCRAAILGIFGTLMPRRCACAGHSHQQLSKCELIRTSLHRNKCVDYAKAQFSRTTLPTALAQVKTGATLIQRRQDLIRMCKPPGMPGLSQGNAPAPQPAATQIHQIYRNDTGCFALCKCDMGGVSASCREIICSSMAPCIMDDGRTFLHGDRVSSTRSKVCACFGGEVVCTRADQNGDTTLASTPGTTLFVGYSSLEANQLLKYQMTFDDDTVTSQLHVTMEDHGMTDMCEISGHRTSPGFLVLQFVPHRLAKPHEKTDCARLGAKLVSLINTRDASLTRKVYLNTLKVAALASSETYNHNPRSGASTLSSASDLSQRQSKLFLVSVGWSLVVAWNRGLW